MRDYSHLKPRIPRIRILPDPKQDEAVTEDELITFTIYDAEGNRKA